MQNLSIKTPSQATKAAFEALKTSTGKKLTAAQVLELLVNQQVNPAPAGGFTQSNPAAEAQLKKVNLEKEQLIGRAIEQTNDLIDAEARLAECLQLLETAHAALQTQQVSPPDFICKPKGKPLQAIIEKIQPAFYKQGFTKNPNQAEYKNELANYALRYLIENEFKKYITA